MGTADLIRKSAKVDELITEPDIFVYLAYGYHYDGAHCFGEETLTDALKTLRSVEPCACESCKNGLAGVSAA